MGGKWKMSVKGAISRFIFSRMREWVENEGIGNYERRKDHEGLCYNSPRGSGDHIATHTDCKWCNGSNEVVWIHGTAHMEEDETKFVLTLASPEREYENEWKWLRCGYWCGAGHNGRIFWEMNRDKWQEEGRRNEEHTRSRGGYPGSTTEAAMNVQVSCGNNTQKQGTGQSVWGDILRWTICVMIWRHMTHLNDKEVENELVEVGESWEGKFDVALQDDRIDAIHDSGNQQNLWVRMLAWKMGWSEAHHTNLHNSHLSSSLGDTQYPPFRFVLKLVALKLEDLTVCILQILG